MPQSQRHDAAPTSDAGSEREQRRWLRRASKRRRRGGHNRAPVPVQRLARGVESTATAARDVGVAAVSGDKPLVLAVLAVAVAGVVLVSGPMQHYLDGRDRVELLERQLSALDDENARLQARADALQDPEQIELLAREQQGMIRPGEVPYVVVPPEVDRPRIAPAPPEDLTPDRPWYLDIWDTLAIWLG